MDQGCSPTHVTHGPADGHRNVTPSPARRVMRGPPTPEHIILEKVTSKGRGSRDACATRVNTHILRESYAPRHQVIGRPQGLHWAGATSAQVTCENVARGTFSAARKALSVKEREGGPNTDLSFRLTSLSHKQDKRWASGPTHRTNEPAGSRRRTRECYAEPSPPRRTGLPDTRAHGP